MGSHGRKRRVDGWFGGDGVGRLLVAPVAVLAVAGLAGCLADDIDLDETGGGLPGAETYSIGGEVSGIVDGSLSLTLNDSETLTLNADGAFTFSTELPAGQSYTVTVDGHPDFSFCDLSGGQGTVASADITGVLAECEVLSIGTVNRDRAVDLDWSRSGDVDIAYSTDRECDWLNVSSCSNGGLLPDQSGGSVTIDESDGLVADEVYSFVLMVGDQASRPAYGELSRFELSGTVLDTVIANDRAYAGGEFLLYGAPVQGIARFRADGDEALLTGAYTDVSIDGGSAALFDTAPAPDGGRFIAGGFDRVDGTARTHIARLNPDGSVDENWSVAIVGDGVTSLLVDEDEGHIYIGGQFTEVAGNANYANLARLDLDGNLDTSFGTASPNGIVWAMDVSDDLLYLGGGFTQIGTETRMGVGAMDLGDGTVSADFDPELDNQVQVLRHDQGQVYLGGQFTMVNGTARTFLASVDAVDGTLDPDFAPVLDGVVITMTELDGDLLVGGGFTTVNGSPRTALALLDSQSGDVLNDWNVTITGGVIAIHIDEDFVYLGGEIEEIAGFERHDLARFHRDTQAIDEDWVPQVDSEVVWDIHGGDHLTVAGQLRGAGGEIVNHLAAFELATGELDSNFDAGTDDRVRALIADSQQLFVGGDFSETYHAGSTTANAYAAAVDLSDGSDQGWQPSPDGDVYDMVINDTDDVVYLGGVFDAVGGETRQGLAAVEKVDGTLIATPDPAIGGAVFSLSWADSYDTARAVIVGGSFASAGGETRNNHAVFSENLGSVHPDNLAPNATLYATAYSSSENYQLMGGNFQSVDGNAQARFAAFENDTTFDASAPNANDFVRAISIDAGVGRVIAGGRFDEFGGEVRENLAIMDYTSGSGLALSSDTLEIDAEVETIDQNADYVVLGGEFRYVGGERHAGLVILDGTTLDSVLGGPSLTTKRAPATVNSTKQRENPLLEALPSLRR